MAENEDLVDEAYAVNGRGGDGGIDIHIKRNGRLVIAQLKCFPEGFSGGFARTRRRQIQESFDSAIEHDPAEWLLVVPATLSPSERTFVKGLVKRVASDRRRPSVVVFDRPRLDALAAKHPNLGVYFMRDELRDAARDYQQESALLIDVEDVRTRVAKLQEQADTLHPDWRLGFFSDGDIVGTTLIAKHPKAAERSPVTLTLTTAFRPDQDELRRSFERAMHFGTPGRIDLPASVVETFRVDRPEFIAEESKNVELAFVAVNRAGEGTPVALVLYDDLDHVVASFAGRTTWLNGAARGGSIHATFFETVSVEVLLPFDRAEEVRFMSSIDMSGSAPSDVVRAVSMLEQLELAHGLGIELDGEQVARLLTQHQPDAFGDNREAILAHRELAKDLAFVQDATNRHFGYPAQVELLDCLYARCLRLLLEGKCIVIPGMRQVTPRLHGTGGASARALLSGEASSLIIEMEDFGLEIFDQKILVGGARIYAPKVRAVDIDGALALFDAGAAKGREVTIRADDDYGFWAYLPAHYEEPPDQRLRPSALGVEGVLEAPDVARALETP